MNRRWGNDLRASLGIGGQRTSSQLLHYSWTQNVIPTKRSKFGNKYYHSFWRNFVLTIIYHIVAIEYQCHYLDFFSWSASLSSSNHIILDIISSAYLIFWYILAHAKSSIMAHSDRYWKPRLIRSKLLFFSTNI